MEVTIEHVPLNAFAVKVSEPTGRPLIVKTVDAPAATSNECVTVRVPTTMTWMQVPSVGALVMAMDTDPV